MVYTRAKQILDFIVQWESLARQEGDDIGWICLKLSTTRNRAATLIGQAKETMGAITWNQNVMDARRRREARLAPVPAEAAATNGEGHPVLDPTTVDAAGLEAPGYDAKAAADRMVADWLERQVDHYQGQLKDLLLKEGPAGPGRTPRELLIHSNLKAFSAAAILAAGRALDLIAEDKQRDRDETRRLDQAAERERRLAAGPYGNG